MEANMSLLKRRLNKAMLECRWQASCTARRLAGRMQVQMNQGGQSQVVPKVAPNRRHFSYSFQCETGNTPGRGQLMSMMASAAATKNPNFGDEDEEEQQQVVEEFSSDDSQDQSQQHGISHRRRSQKMSSPLNSSQQQQHFVRSSALSGSRRYHNRSSRRRRSHRAARQVRFQPIPQSIGDDSNDETKLESQTAKMPKTRAKLGQLQMRLRVAHHAAKPLTRRLQHLKFTKIKLKSFNTIAQQLQQTLASSSSSSFAPTPQQQGPSKETEPTTTINDLEDDCGWGSDFSDEQSVESGSNEQPNSYLLEIGRPSDDKRAIDDVIQDRGISGQFKRLEVGDDEEQQVAKTLFSKVDQPEEDVLDGDVGEQVDDDEDELRSLEARQGFRQIKDKLKVILDQRLADYERSASASSGATCEPTTQPTCIGEPEELQSQPPTISNSTKVNNESTTKVDVEDCQSHCSDDSSLVSNHSGSQDSGHSTQHSGYSAHCPLHHHQPGSLETRSSSETGDLSSVAISQVAVTQSAKTATKAPSTDCDERRSRFLQNRLIINSKLESMFQQRAPTSKASLEGCERKIAAASASTGSAQVQRSHTMAVRSQSGQVFSIPENASKSDETHEETRMRLLEQQRQMSLKLKQKPRRRTTARSIARCRTGEAKPEEVEQQDRDLGSYASARDSLTKQLSMVCLGGGGQSVAATTYDHHQPLSNLQAQPARSLRQLVTEVIDDCERPSKLSTLTMSILNRSDSSSSDLAISADDLTTASSPLRLPQPTSTGVPGPPYSSCNHHQQSPDPKHLAPASPYQLHHQLRLAALNAANLSVSSVGSTIDGLEYSPIKGEESIVIVPPTTTAEARKQGQKSHNKLGSYLKSLREFSKFRLPKVRLDGVKLGNNSNHHLNTTTERPPVVEPRLLAGARQHLNTHSTLAGAWRRRCQAVHVSSKPSGDQLGSAASVLASGADQSEAFTNHFVTISNRKWKSCHLRTSLMQVAFNSPNGATNTGASSPVCASKQHLAYLDNSKNFTDDDYY